MSKYINEAYWIAAQARVVPLAVENPGVAKTATAATFAKALGRDFFPVNMGELDPVDVSGYPTPVQDENGQTYMTYGLPEWKHKAMQSERGAVVLLDEINRSPAHQAACQYVTHSGIPGNVLVLAAMNPTESSTDGYELGPSFVNRMFYHYWETGVLDWCQAMISGSFSSDFPILPKNWENRKAASRARVAAYIQKNPVKFNVFPKDTSKRSLPWASKRSWTHVADLLAAGDSVGASLDLRQQLVRGCVGDSAAMEFAEWEKDTQIPDVEEWLRDPKKYKKPERHDILVSALGAMTAIVFDKAGSDYQTNADYRNVFGQAMLVMERVMEKDKEIAFSMTAPLVLKAPTNAMSLYPKKVMESMVTLQGKIVSPQAA